MGPDQLPPELSTINSPHPLLSPQLPGCNHLPFFLLPWVKATQGPCETCPHRTPQLLASWAKINPFPWGIARAQSSAQSAQSQDPLIWKFSVKFLRLEVERQVGKELLHSHEDVTTRQRKLSGLVTHMCDPSAGQRGLTAHPAFMVRTKPVRHLVLGEEEKAGQHLRKGHPRLSVLGPLCPSHAHKHICMHTFTCTHMHTYRTHTPLKLDKNPTKHTRGLSAWISGKYWKD